MCRRFESAPRHQVNSQAPEGYSYINNANRANLHTRPRLVPKVGVEPTRAKPKGF